MVDALQEASFDLLVNAVVGSAGLLPTATAIQKGVSIALANKETLVMAGEWITQQAQKHKVDLIPIDSEHSALSMLLRRIPRQNVHRLILTASGGPFFKKSVQNPSIKEVISHPTWSMGAKISVDSATMMNKGLEIIEAHHLFATPYDRIEAIIHPQSCVHAFVETIDTELYAQMGHTDMRIPIQHALTYPKEQPSSLERFRLWDKGGLYFYPVDSSEYPLLDLAIECGKKGGSAPLVLNAANEAAVGLFLGGKISFEMIFSIVHRTISSYNTLPLRDIEEIVSLDQEIKERIWKDHCRNVES